jgi:hypothetical protein
MLLAMMVSTEPSSKNIFIRLLNYKFIIFGSFDIISKSLKTLNNSDNTILKIVKHYNYASHRYHNIEISNRKKFYSS